jgi:hypothetical protein
MCKVQTWPLADTIPTECSCKCRAQTAAEPVGTGAEAVLQAVTRATAPSGPLAGDRKVRFTLGTYIVVRRLDHSICHIALHLDRSLENMPSGVRTLALFRSKRCISPRAQVANLILGDVAALAALGRAVVLCALADAQRLLAAAAAAAAPKRHPKLGSMAAARAPADSDRAPQQRAHVQRPVQRPAGGRRSRDRQDGNDGGGVVSTVDPQLRRQLRLAALHVSSFLLPWANEQPPGVFLEVAQAAADGWQRWWCA